ncbi:hypothetical protein PoB_000333800 [Plakobranchus ocellatus]|uniref:Uncharacterized protein n=1 Tax=Plakobranchus ocellatus TaxID=259542 RepID=A0AAV3Y2H3_9GAST|nr:hypothetical protein PoB_000333800 [Plakobranchus ocellatus]
MDLACPLSPRARDFSISSLMTGPAGLDSMLEGGNTITSDSNNNNNSSNSSSGTRNSILNNNSNNETKDLSSVDVPSSHRLEQTSSCGLGAGSLGGPIGSESLSSVLGHCIASGVQSAGQGHPDCVFSSWSHQVSQYNTLSSMQASPQQGDLRLSGPPSGQGAGGGARTRDRMVPADLRADSLATVPPTPPLSKVHKNLYRHYTFEFSSILIR